MKSEENTVVITRSHIPIQSKLHSLEKTSYYFDSYEVTMKENTLTAYELYSQLLATTPSWVNFMMRIREKIVPLLGVRKVGLLGSQLTSSLSTTNVYVGAKADIFTIVSLSDEEIIVGENDTHLDFKLSLLKLQESEPHRLVVTMVVNVNNWVGIAYMKCVIPFHKIIMKTYLKNAKKKSIV